MTFPPHLRSAERAALWATVALWGLTFCIFLLTAVTGRNGLQLWHALFYFTDVLTGLVASGPVYLLVRATEGLSVGRRTAALAAASAVAAAVVSLVDAWLYLQFQPRFEPGVPAPPAAGLVGFNLLIYVWIFGFYTTVQVLISAGEKMRQRERQLAEARTQAHQAQLAALRFQLNPHFLFNTLNAISTLIVTGRNEEAEAMMQKLSDFLRASLGADPAGFVVLEDELATVEAYLDIESVRFGERLNVEVVCPDGLADALVPSFLLQPLVENAVKYAVAPSSRTVTIRVEATDDGDDLVLTVEDDGEAEGRGPTRSGTGVGLANVRERLRALYGDRGVLEAAPRSRGFLALARLPLARASAARMEAA